MIVRSFALFCLLFSPTVLAHGGHSHGSSEKPKGTTEANSAINQAYLQKIKPIFVRSCFDCHSNQTAFPWYYKIPLVKQYLDQDIAEGRKHLDLSPDFPFKGHGTATEDLQAIEKEVREEEMPPWNYRLVHPRAALSEAEKKQIYDWVSGSLAKFPSH